MQLKPLDRFQPVSQVPLFWILIIASLSQTMLTVSLIGGLGLAQNLMPNHLLEIRSVILVSLAVLGVVAVIATIVAHWITRPIHQLTEMFDNIVSACNSENAIKHCSSECLEKWNQSQQSTNFQVKEFNHLARAFNQITRQLQHSFAKLEQTNQDLELRVEQRTLQLKLADVKFEKIFRSSPIVLIIINLEEQSILDVNQCFTQTLGFSKDQVIGIKIQDLNLWVDISQYDEIVDGLRQGITVLNQDVQFFHQNQQTIDLELSGEIIAFNEQSCVLFAGSDVTSRKRADVEKDMRHNHLELQQFVMTNLSTCPEIYAGDIEASLQKITQLAAHTLDATAVSIWFYNIDHSQIECADCYEIAQRIHLSQDTRRVEHYPTYFKSLETHPIVCTYQTQFEACNPEFLALSLSSNSTSLAEKSEIAILDVPVRSGDITLGVLHMEQVGIEREWQLDEQNFATYLAHMVSLAVESHDHTETEIVLRKNEELLRQLTENIESMLWIGDPQSQEMVYLSPAYERIWGRSRREIYQNPQAFFDAIHPEDRDAMVVYLEHQLYRKCSFEYRIIKPGGETRWIYEQAFPIRNSSDEVYRVVGISEDISNRKQYEAKIRASLNEKEILLKEVHHRVKNNLHIISNLLELQSDSIEDESLLDLFAESQNRISSMALIHEQLYLSDNLGEVDFKNYIHQLVENLFFSLEEGTGAIRSTVDVEPVQLNLETAVPCGLLINELVTNCFKHAFPGGSSGEVCVKLHREPQSLDQINPKPRLHLTICDDGVGIPADVDWENSASLGLKLVRILSKQLRGDLQINCTNGTCIELFFSELQYKSRF
ncbi:MAG: histidine kinase dimerization/phosphoacceptor domain -containing protein [Microcoleaceae cyanobacterium]